MFDLKINVGLCDLYFKVQWFCEISWKLFDVMNIILQDYGSVWPDVWPQNKCRSLWLYFLVQWFCLLSPRHLMDARHSWYNGSVWHKDWLHQVYVGQWPIFHGPVILPYISKTIWWTSVIFSDNETVWPKLWPQNKYRSTLSPRLFDGWTS